MTCDPRLDLRNRVRALWVYANETKRWADWDRLDEIPPEDLDAAMRDVIAFAESVRAMVAGLNPTGVSARPFYKPGVVEGLIRERDSHLAGVTAVASDELGRRYEARKS